LSKEIARQYYRKTEWYKEVKEAKKKAQEEGIADWKKLVKTQPLKLDSQLKTIIGQTYMTTTNELTKRRKFDVLNLAETMERYLGYSKSHKK
jgi:phosphoribosylaminoimidazole-succinocarboxamide synthase